MTHFADALEQVRKDQPCAGDVHVDSAGGTGRARRKLKKGLESGDFSIRIPITKTEVVKGEEGAPDQNRVFGWASVIEKDGKVVIDVQDDTISSPDLEEAFYDFVKHARNAGEMHSQYGQDIGTCIECMVFTKEKQEIMKIDLGFVGAWIGFEVSPDVFAKVKDGTYPAFSIGGSGMRVAA